MQRLSMLAAVFAALLGRGAASAPGPLEAEVAALIAGPQVTVVHFWAPWCPNCRAEMGPDGWAKFVGANPGAKFVFINIWHRGLDPAPRLREGGLGAQPNLTLFNHPNPSSREADRPGSFLGLPLTWLPTTWIYRDGRLRYALNYGEIHFPLLQTLVDDTRDKARWAR